MSFLIGERTGGARNRKRKWLRQPGRGNAGEKRVGPFRRWPEGGRAEDGGELGLRTEGKGLGCLRKGSGAREGEGSRGKRGD